MAVPFVRWLLPTTWKTGAKFSGKWEGSSAWLMVARQRTGARKHHGATVICVAEFVARIAAFWLVGAHEKHVERLGQTCQAGRSESSLGGSFGKPPGRSLGKLTNRIVWTGYREGIAGSRGSFGRKRR